MHPISAGILLTVLFSCAFIEDDKPTKNNKAHILYSHGTSLLVEKNHTKALKLLLQAYELEPTDSKTNNNLGMAYYFKGDIPKAIEHLNYAIQQDDRNLDAKNNLASLYLNTGDLDKALAQYKAIENNLDYENRYRTLYNIALVYDAKGQLGRAIDYLKLSLQENGDHCPSSLQLALYSYSSEDYPKALELLRSATMGPCVQNPEPHYYTGQTLMHLKRYPEAKEIFLNIQNNFPETEYASLSNTALNNIPPSHQDSGYISEARERLKTIANEKQDTIQGAKF